MPILGSAGKKKLVVWMMTAALAVVAVVVFWFSVLYPKYLQHEIAQFESNAVQIAHVFESQINSQALNSGPFHPELIERLLPLSDMNWLLKVKLFDRNGRVIYSSTPAEIGEVNRNAYFSEQVMRGRKFTKLVRRDENIHDGGEFDADVIETYVPIVRMGVVQGAFEIYLDVTDNLSQLMVFTRSLSKDFLIITTILLFVMLALIRRSFKRALLIERGQRRELQAEIRRRKGVEANLREKEQHFDYLAHHDTLTDLPNRRLFLERLDHALAASVRSRCKNAVLFLDLDRFKTINDSLGHEIGDELITQVSAVLAETVRDGDTVARMGGDEFTILIEKLEDEMEAGNLAERILKLLNRSFVIGDHRIKTDVSIGIAIAPHDGACPDDLLKNADTAMYQAKEHGRGCFRYYMPEMNARAEVKLRLENSITAAIASGQMCIHYQPQISLITGRMRGVEALVRWVHPEMGMVMPGDFIPLAEESGAIVEMGEWLLHESCRQLRAWGDAGHQDLVMAVNLSARQFRDHGLFDKVVGAISAAGIHPHQLELELTESLIMARPEEGVSMLQRFHEAGLRIAVDDFGTGYSSLSYLRKFPISQLKIDRSFVKDIDQQDDANIVDTIITLAHSLDLEVVAEGIETVQQLRFLQGHGCEFGQGYLFAKALVASEISHRLEFERFDGTAARWGKISGLQTSMQNA